MRGESRQPGKGSEYYASDETEIFGGWVVRQSGAFVCLVFSGEATAERIAQALNETEPKAKKATLARRIGVFNRGGGR